MNSYMANSKLFITDNNYQSYQSSTIKKGSLTRIKESKWAINFIRIQLAPELCEEINLLV